MREKSFLYVAAAKEGKIFLSTKYYNSNIHNGAGPQVIFNQLMEKLMLSKIL